MSKSENMAVKAVVEYRSSTERLVNAKWDTDWGGSSVYYLEDFVDGEWIRVTDPGRVTGVTPIPDKVEDKTVNFEDYMREHGRCEGCGLPYHKGPCRAENGDHLGYPRS